MTADNVVLGCVDTLSPAGRVERLIADAAGGGFVAKLADWVCRRWVHTTRPGGSGGGEGFVAVRHGRSLDVEELVMKMIHHVLQVIVAIICSIDFKFIAFVSSGGRGRRMRN